MGQTQIENVRYRHQAIVDIMLQSPEKDQNEISAQLGVTPQHLSVVVNSDAFKEYFDIRRSLHADNISHGLIENVEGLADEVVEVIREKVQKERSELGLGALTDTAKVALSALGIGGSRRGAVGGSGPTQNNFYIGQGVNPKLLEQARNRMKQVNGGLTVASSEPYKGQHEIEEENSIVGEAKALPAT